MGKEEIAAFFIGMAAGIAWYRSFIDYVLRKSVHATCDYISNLDVILKKIGQIAKGKVFQEEMEKAIAELKRQDEEEKRKGEEEM